MRSIFGASSTVDNFRGNRKRRQKIKFVGGNIVWGRQVLKKLSEPTISRRAQMLRRKTRHSGRSG